MKVAIDLTALMPKTTGIDTYLLEMVRNLAKLDRKSRYTLFLNFADRKRFDGELGENIVVRACCPRPRTARRCFNKQRFRWHPLFPATMSSTPRRS